MFSNRYKVLLTHWLVFFVLVVVLATVVGGELVRERQRIEASERLQLSSMANVIQTNVEIHLQAVNRALISIAEKTQRASDALALNEYLHSLQEAMPQVRTLAVHNSSGIVEYASRPEVIGSDSVRDNRSYFLLPRAHPNAETLYVSPPFRTNLNVYTVVLSRAIIAANGDFAGVVTATLDRWYFDPLLKGVLYADDLVASLQQEEGLLFVIAPSRYEGLLGSSVSSADSTFVKHLQSGQSESVLTGPIQAIGDDRTIVQRTIRPADLHMDEALVVTVSRQNDQILANWYRDIAAMLGIFLISVLVCGWGLLVFQRHQKKYWDSEQQHAKELAQSAQYLRSIIDSEPECVATLMRSRAITEINVAGLALFQANTSAELLGRDILDFILPEYRPAFQAFMDHAIQGEPGVLSCELMDVAGQRKYVEAHVSPMFDSEGKLQSLLAVMRDVSEHHTVEEAIRRSEERLRRAEQISLSGNWELSLDTGLLSASSGAMQIYGLEERTWYDPELIRSIALPEDRPSIGAAFKALIERRVPYDLEYRICRGPEAEIRDIHSVGTLDEDRRIVFGVLRDITEQKRIERSLKLAASVFTHAREGILITNEHCHIVDVNEAFTRITGYPREEVLGLNPRLLQSGRHDMSYYASMWHGLLEKGHWSGEIWNKRKNGEIYPELITLSTLFDERGDIQNFVALFTDITGIKEYQRKLEFGAYYDALTKLPNRVLLSDRLHLALSKAERNQTVAIVAYLDLDGFKQANDTSGHAAGDQILVTVATRLKKELRASDTVARLGGDEFVVLITDMEAPEDCLPVLRRMLHAIAQPVEVGDISHQVTASIGVSSFPRDGHEADKLVRLADQAMYQAKQSGKNSYRFFGEPALMD